MSSIRDALLALDVDPAVTLVDSLKGNVELAKQGNGDEESHSSNLVDLLLSLTEFGVHSATLTFASDKLLTEKLNTLSEAIMEGITVHVYMGKQAKLHLSW